MKRIFTSFLAIALLATSASAAFVDPTPRLSPISTVAAEPVLPGQFTVASIEQMTGKKLNFVQKIAVKVAAKKARKSTAGKSQLAATLLCFFLGGLGIHRFYLGYTWQGVVQLLTLGGLGIWALIDFVRIIIGDLQPKDSEYDSTF